MTGRPPRESTDPENVVIAVMNDTDPLHAANANQLNVAEPPICITKPRSVLLVGAISSAGFLTVLNVQSVVIMLPSIATDLGIPVTRKELIVSVYNISLGCTLLFWARLGDVYGHRRIFLMGTISFAIANLTLPFSTYEIIFYVLRVVQGMSGAAMIPSGIGIAASIYAPGPRRSAAFVVISATASLGSVAGNIFGGVVGGFVSWKWAFWISAVLSTITAFTMKYVTSTPTLQARLGSECRIVHKGSVDWTGGIMISSSLLLLLIALTEGNAIGWKTPWISPLIVVSLALLAAFTYHQHRMEVRCAEPPLIRISIFKRARFTKLFVMIGFFYASFNGFTIFVTYFLQGYAGLNELQTTLRFLPSGISGVLVSCIVLWFASRVPAFYILTTGCVCAALSPLLLAISSIPPDTTYWAWIFPAMCVCCSVEIIWPIASIIVSEELPQANQAMGSGLLQTVNNVGRALGLTVATAVQTAVSGDSTLEPKDSDLLKGIRAGQWVNFGAAVASLIIVLTSFRNVGSPSQP